MNLANHVFSVCMLAMLPQCTPTLSSGDRSDLADTAGKLAKCQAEGREAGTYAAYEDCKVRAGLGDSGAP